MEISQIIPHVEALIFAADRPLPVLEIVDLLNNALAFLEDRATLDQVETALEAVREKYHSEFYAFEVRQSGGGYQFLTKKDYYQTVAQLNGEKFLKRLSTAALETLAIIAYKQPISKGEIEHIRGVSSDYSIQKLLEKELIIISGRSEELPGKPLLYATSKAFMDYFGLNSPADLPKLREVFDEEAVQPTLIGGESLRHINGNGLVILENGELVEGLNIDEAETEADTPADLEIPENVHIPDVDVTEEEETTLPPAAEPETEDVQDETFDEPAAEAPGGKKGEEEEEEEEEEDTDEEDEDDLDEEDEEEDEKDEDEDKDEDEKDKP